MEKRKDSKGRVLKEHENQRKNGTYEYKWRTSDGLRHCIYAKTLNELREKELQVLKDISDGIKVEAKNITVNDVYDMWENLKRGLKDSTFQNYRYMYNQFARDTIGKYKLAKLKRSDIRRFYNYLIDERGLTISSVDVVHTVLHQILTMAVEDEYIRTNISDLALKELKQVRNLNTEKRKSLSLKQQNALIDFLKRSPKYRHWLPIITVLVGAGLRIGEATGLRWCDVDFENNTISINHTLIYYNHANNKCYFGINTPKSKAGFRTIPMIDSVREAFIEEKKYQEITGIKCCSVVDGYSDFIFINRFGNVQHQGTINKAIRRIVRDYNMEVLSNNKNVSEDDLLPRFSCHILRHTFCTRLCEFGINIKAIQSMLGHSDINTTMDIYADATKDLKEREMITFNDFMKNKEEHITTALRPKYDQKQEMYV